MFVIPALIIFIVGHAKHAHKLKLESDSSDSLERLLEKWSFLIDDSSDSEEMIGAIDAEEKALGVTNADLQLQLTKNRDEILQIEHLLGASGGEVKVGRSIAGRGKSELEQDSDSSDSLDRMLERWDYLFDDSSDSEEPTGAVDPDEKAIGVSLPELKDGLIWEGVELKKIRLLLHEAKGPAKLPPPQPAGLLQSLDTASEPSEENSKCAGCTVYRRGDGILQLGPNNVCRSDENEPLTMCLDLNGHICYHSATHQGGHPTCHFMGSGRTPLEPRCQGCGAWLKDNVLVDNVGATLCKFIEDQWGGHCEYDGMVCHRASDNAAGTRDCYFMGPGT